MSSTRYAPPTSDPDAAPERFLASSKLRGIQIGLNVITRVARVRSERERSAMIWLHNYARLQNLTADALSDELDLSKPDIRAALTDPDADLQRFVRQVEKLRAEFESTLDAPVRTKPYTILEEGLALAKKRKVPVEIVGHTRMGKTLPAFNWYQRNAMDRGIFVKCPEDESDRTFLAAIADKLGISAIANKKIVQIRPQIVSCFGKGLLDFIVVDEAHFLWPNDRKAKPKRLEFLRGLFDMHVPSQVGVVILATPQFTASMNEAMTDNRRWAPGQWDGRVIRYHFPDTMSDADLRAVAEHHAPDFSGDMIEKLVMHARATHGFCGAMVNAIMLAREKAELRGSKRVTADILREAQQQMVAGTRIAELAKAKSDQSKIKALAA